MEEQRPTEPTLDDVFHILRNERRRNALFYLKHTDGIVDISDLSEQVAAWENDIKPEELSSQERKRVYIALYQNHLPLMDKDDIINYDKDRGDIQKGIHAPVLEYYLEGPLTETPELTSEFTRPELQVSTTETTETPSEETPTNSSFIRKMGSLMNSASHGLF